MPLYPMGYLITFGTYGARLRGSSKPFVDEQHNEYGAPPPRADAAREAWERQRMSGPAVSLSVEQRQVAEAGITDVSLRYEWTVRAIAVQSDHAHVAITAVREGEALRDALKAAASRALNQQFGKRKWWAEGGSAKYLWERSYFENAVAYVLRQRDW